MQFTGPAKPLTGSDVIVIAGYLGCHVAAVRAVLAVETRGNGFHNGHPIILNEPHIFWRELGAGAKRDRAVKEGLAYQKWGTKPYPKTQAQRYAWLASAMMIDEGAALRSCSWGLGQVMGFNHTTAGFRTVQAMVAAMTLSEGAQLYAMARFIVSNGLHKYLRKLAWASFAKGYNGAGYANNQYDMRLAESYAKRPESEKHTPPPSTEDQLMALIGAGKPAEAPRPPDNAGGPGPGQPPPASPFARLSDFFRKMKERLSMKRLSFIGIIVATALAVAGCAQLQNAIGTISNVQVTQKVIDTARAGYSAGFLAWASEYRDLYDENPCPTDAHASLQNICAEYGIVERAQGINAIVRPAFDQLQADFDVCQATSGEACKGLPAAYKTLSTAIDAGKALAAEFAFTVAGG